MKSPRLLLVGRRFWPLVGGAESTLSSLGVEFRRQGAEPTILTARWQSDWPAEIVYRGVRVVRLPNPAVRGWRTLRYMLALARWLRGHAGEFDLVYVSMLRHDAFTALEARGSGPPVVLRAEGAGESGDCAWHERAPFGHRIARLCRTADAIVAPSPAARDELLSAAFPKERVHLVPNGVAIPHAPIDAAARYAARAALAEANPELALPSGASLAVCIGRLHASRGLAALVAAWQDVTARRPNTWLWLVGEGPLEEDLRRMIAEAGLTGRVVLAGVFDDVEDLLRAANLFVQPAIRSEPSSSLLEALAAGLPVVATDTPGNREVIESGRHGLLAEPDDPTALSAAIESLLAEPASAAALATAGRERVGKDHSLAKMAREHLHLFDRLLAGARP